MAAIDHHLASSRYQEDVWPRGHKSAWGSWYCKSTGRWGLACCQSTDRNALGCTPVDSEAETTASRNTSGGGGDSAERLQAREWRPREAFETPEGFVAYAAKYLVSCWRMWLADGILSDRVRTANAEAAKVLLSTVAVDEASRGVETFCERLASRQVPKDLAKQLEEFCSCVHSREYAQANKIYMEIVLGSRKWQLDVPYLVEGNRNGPSVVQNVAERLNKESCDPLDVAGIRNHTVLLRRLLSVAQVVNPNEDPSKNCG